MAAIFHSIDRENNFRRAVEVIGLLQDQEVWTKLGDPKRGAITYYMHFHLR